MRDGRRHEDRFPAAFGARRGRRPRRLRRRGSRGRRRGRRRFGGGSADLVARAAAGRALQGQAEPALVDRRAGRAAVDRLIVVGIGGEKERAKLNWAQLGGVIAGKRLGPTGDGPRRPAPGARGEPARRCAEMALGARLRGLQVRSLQDQEEGRGPRREPDQHRLRRSPTRRGREGRARRRTRSPRACSSPATSSTSRRTCSARRSSPRRAEELRKLGVEVEVLDEKAHAASSACGRCSPSARARSARAGSWSCAGTAPRAARQAGRLHRQGRRASIPAASRSSRPAAWRT